MKDLNKQNREKVINFVKENINRSLFIYGNINGDDAIVRYKEVNEEIVGLYVISLNKYITYLFDEKISQEDEMEIVSDAQNYKHSEGTVVAPKVNVFEQFYKFKKDDKHETEIAVLKPEIKYSKSDDIEILDLDCESDLNQYIMEAKKVNFNYSVDTFKSDYESAKIYILRGEENEIIASATISGISEYTGVIVGVFTNANYRNQGIASRIVEHLIADNETLNRTFFIFFDNPKAKSVYLNLGFSITNTMSMIEKK